MDYRCSFGSTGATQHIMRALEWFQRAGLSEPKARTFIRDICSPLNPEMRKPLEDLLEMRWGKDNAELLKEDQLEYQRLCRKDSPGCILNMPRYYAFFTYSLLCGTVV